MIENWPEYVQYVYVHKQACMWCNYKWSLFICWCLCGKISVLHPFARLNWLSWPVECSLPRGPSCWICQWITHEPLSAWQGGSNAIADGFIPWSWNVKSWQHIAATLLWPPDNVRNSFLPAPLHSSPANIARFWVNDASPEATMLWDVQHTAITRNVDYWGASTKSYLAHQTGFIQNLSSASCTKLVRARKAVRKFCRAAGVQGLPCWSVRRW